MLEDVSKEYIKNSKNMVKKIFNKSFLIGLLCGVLFIILSIIGFGAYCGSHPVTDCDSCVNGTTP